MNSPQPPSSGAGASPTPLRYDPRTEPVPESLATLEKTETVVLLLSASSEKYWAADTAIALSSNWAHEGRRIVLADLHLDDPVLHERLGEPNLEGVSDIFFYGASLARSARPAGTRGFYLITAGTYSNDPEALYRHRRWDKLVKGFADADASLIVFSPAESPGIDVLIGRASAVIFLGNETGGRLGESGTTISAILTPPETTTAATLENEPVPETLDDIFGPDARLDHDLFLPPISPRVKEPAGPGRIALIVLLIAVIALAAAGYYAALFRPDLIPWIREVPPDSVVEMELLDAATAIRAPVPSAMELPYSVQVKAFTSFGAAMEEATMVSERSPEVPVFVSPERIGGVLYFKVLAGASPDSLSTTLLRQSLVEAGSIEPQDAQGFWSLIQHTPLTFPLGEYPSREEALSRIDSLSSLAIPAYDIWISYNDGSTRWRVYGGAFRSEADAVAMREVLSDAGFSSSLVTRLGGRASE